MENVIEIKDLVKIFSSKKHNVVALNEINLKIARGTIFSFLGPNGAGKTTTVRLLSCLLKPTAGEASSGLGLAIAREIIAAHGGTITATGDRGKGLAFRIDLPMHSSPVLSHTKS